MRKCANLFSSKLKIDAVFTVKFKTKFAQEFKNFPTAQQDKILDFIEIFQKVGLSDFTKYEGKISPSWASLNITDTNYHYAKQNHLWHYHIGIPIYEQRHSKYKTSDVVLHFQWQKNSTEIYLVDIYQHYTKAGNFYLPSKDYLQ